MTSSGPHVQNHMTSPQTNGERVSAPCTRKLLAGVLIGKQAQDDPSPLGGKHSYRLKSGMSKFCPQVVPPLKGWTLQWRVFSIPQKIIHDKLCCCTYYLCGIHTNYSYRIICKCELGPAAYCLFVLHHVCIHLDS